MRHLLIALPLVAGCAASAPALEVRSAEPGSLAQAEGPMASEGYRLVWTEDEEPTVEDLLGEYARVTGQTVVYTQEAKHQIERKRLHKAGGAEVLEVPADEVQSVTEALLLLHNFVLIPLHGDEPRIVQVISLETQERNQVKRNSVYVPFEDLERWRRRPASLVTTTLWLENTDVRTLSNSMRTMLTDANTQQIIPVGNSNGLLLTGFAPDVCALADMLRRIDELGEPTGAEEPTGTGGEGPR